ncbi:ABC transporter ATP-binding protein [Azospirillum sp. YIM B02556]|uniref:ABC transporter ATP-binding protein n=1 Tax=Azospirillum endophyticum TaxID=2800326 RepID=A0ABS1FF76_9PROT|nr:ABC transporter ATP-binding protein [Azospirillum endophyticum]MBK1842081.1 ABC transporter ATP-binding protein [Azospirillum endophyticum]
MATSPAHSPDGVPARARPGAALSTSDLHVRYGEFHALKGIDLAVERGEFVALLGPSGCGKTSLLRTIAGFVHPAHGTVVLNGRNVAGLPARERNIGIVFQSYALFPHMTALENVRFGLECRKLPRGEATERAQRALALVGLSAMAERRPKQLSGGQQQRVALARAIVIEPDLLLLDEPLGALDKQLRVQMQTELKSLQKQLGITAVFVTHDQEEAMSMADRIVVMKDGSIVQVDTPERLFQEPKTGWVCDFVGGGNLLRGPLEPLRSGVLQLELAPGSVIHVRGEGSPQAAVQVPFDKVALRPAVNDGLTVKARRFLGATLALEIDSPLGTIVAHVPPEEGAAYPVGMRVHASADMAHCRLVTVE